jgi:glycosyltransferase involved in cell wall biosynthesis
MTTPHISVLIDTYNHERYIEQAIVSVLEQDFPAAQMEIVVVDDGSTDGTPSIIEKFVPRVRYIKKKNGGQASAFNAGIPQLKGPIVAFLDGDDWWAKTKVSIVAETFEANPEIAAVGHGFYEVRGDEPPHEMFIPAKTCRLDVSNAEAARLANAGLTMLGTSRLSIRREILNRLMPLPEELVFCADAPIFTLALALGGAIIIDRPLCYYRQHSESRFAHHPDDVANSRRRIELLGRLLKYVPPRLLEFGVDPDVVDALVEGPRIEFERAKLQFGEGGRRQVFRTELRRFRANYEHPSPGYVLFTWLVCFCALLLPPRRFYQLLDWYGRNNLKRIRNMFARAQPKVSPAFLERRPVAEREP